MDCKLTIFFIPGESGEGTIELVTQDWYNPSAPATVTIRMLAVNHPPVFATAPPDIYAPLEDSPGPHTSTFRVTDPDGVVDCTDVTVYGVNPAIATSAAITPDGNGNCVLSLQLVPNGNGNDLIQLAVTDDGGLTAVANLTLFVAALFDSHALLVDFTDIVTVEDVNPVVPFTLINRDFPATTLDCQLASVTYPGGNPDSLVAGYVIDDGAGPWRVPADTPARPEQERHLRGPRSRQADHC